MKAEHDRTHSYPVVMADALATCQRFNWKYSTIVHVFHCVELWSGHHLLVVGDGDNGCYEWVSYDKGNITGRSDVAYGETAEALRAGLNSMLEPEPSRALQKDGERYAACIDHLERAVTLLKENEKAS